MNYHYCVLGIPRTKKNSQQIIMNGRTHRPMLIQSKEFRQYEKDALYQLKDAPKVEKYPVNSKVTFFMPTKHRVDLTNLLEAIDDVMVKAGILEDDSWRFIASHDGSRVRFDKEHPRTEIVITEADDEEDPRV